jgi:hypothetical protein
MDTIRLVPPPTPEYRVKVRFRFTGEQGRPVMTIEYWVAVVVQVAVFAAGYGRLVQKVKQIEAQINKGNGVPSDCRVHESRLDDHDRRMEVIEVDFRARGGVTDE